MMAYYIVIGCGIVSLTFSIFTFYQIYKMNKELNERNN